VINKVEGRWNFTGCFRQGVPPWGVHGAGEGATSSFMLKRATFKQVAVLRMPVSPEARSLLDRSGTADGTIRL
jgi:hypothetical protein